jgi:hypothetical protein
VTIRAIQNAFLAATFCVLVGCAATIAPFSQVAYEQATAIKAETLTLMDKATSPYETHKDQVEALLLKVEKAYEYAKGRPKNTFTTDQWLLIKDPNRNSIAGFMKRWSEKSKLDPEFIKEAKGVISEGLDSVIELESGKEKPVEANR